MFISFAGCIIVLRGLRQLSSISIMVYKSAETRLVVITTAIVDITATLYNYITMPAALVGVMTDVLVVLTLLGDALFTLLDRA